MRRLVTLHDLLVGTAEDARRRAPYFRTKKVAILGNTDSIVDTPWSDPTWTLVAHPCTIGKCRREPDWWIDLHRPECFKGKKSWMTDYYGWLKRLQTPIFMQESYREIPASVRYPKERILAEFRPHFTNLVSWTIALALTEGVTTIGLFGCQYAHGTEHSVQRDSCIYWLGRFEGAGGHLVLPSRRNTLLNMPPKLYGYESHDEHGKLIDMYRAKTPAGVAITDGVPRLTVLGPDEVPTHPHIGEPVAWDRSGYAAPSA